MRVGSRSCCDGGGDDNGDSDEGAGAGATTTSLTAGVAAAAAAMAVTATEVVDCVTSDDDLGSKRGSNATSAAMAAAVATCGKTRQQLKPVARRSMLPDARDDEEVCERISVFFELCYEMSTQELVDEYCDLMDRAIADRSECWRKLSSKASVPGIPCLLSKFLFLLQGILPFDLLSLCCREDSLFLSRFAGVSSRSERIDQCFELKREQVRIADRDGSPAHKQCNANER